MLCCCFVQILMSAGRFLASVPTECVSTRLGASAANVRWALATTTYFSFVKVKLRLLIFFCLILLCFPVCVILWKNVHVVVLQIPCSLLVLLPVLILLKHTKISTRTHTHTHLNLLTLDRLFWLCCWITACFYISYSTEYIWSYCLSAS